MFDHVHKRQGSERQDETSIESHSAGQLQTFDGEYPMKVGEKEQNAHVLHTERR